ncbi:MAG TPA: cupin domain-containing protein [bacterium]|nr:cupin domain-containing protein [bacterium]HOL66344.1 cupin domain-containing protein [bacterium]HPP12652.1 cupin domain-containing protein [bacterium]
MGLSYRSLVGYHEGAKKLHIHLTENHPQSEQERTSHYEHSHSAEEVIYVLQGQIECEISGKRKKVGAGESIFFPSRIRHGLMKIITGKAKYLVIRTVEKDSLPCCCGQDKPEKK